MAINAEQWARDRAEIEELMSLYARGNDVEHSADVRVMRVSWHS